MKISFTSNFSKFLIFYLLPMLITIFLLSFILGYFLENNIIMKTQNFGAGKVHRLVENNINDEIPILGSSRALGNFLPEKISPKCFNYGLSGTANYVWPFFLIIELKKNKNTPIIINLDLDDFNEKIGDIKNYIVDINCPEIKKMLGDKIPYYYYIPGIKYYGGYEVFIKQYISSHTKLTKYVNNGANIELNQLPPKVFEENVKAREKYKFYFQYEEEFIVNLKNILKTYNQKHRKIIFVISPLHKSSFVNMPEQTKKNWQLFKQNLAKLPNVYLFDFINYLNDDKDFFNTSHLSLKGAKKFSQALSDKLTEHKLINNE